MSERAQPEAMDSSGQGVTEPAPGPAWEQVFAQSTKTAPANRRLTLSSPAKSLIAVALVLAVAGIAVYLVVLAVPSRNSPGVTDTRALAKLGQANTELAKTTGDITSAVSACNGELTCVTFQDRQIAGALETFAIAIKSIRFSGSASAAAVSLASDASAAAQEMNQLSAAKSVSQYQSLASSGQARRDLDNVRTDYNRLLRDLRAS